MRGEIKGGGGCCPLFIYMYLTRKIENYDYSPASPFILYKYNCSSNPYPGKFANIYYHGHSEYPNTQGINGEVFIGSGQALSPSAQYNQNGGGFLGGFCKVKLQRPTSERKNTEIGYVGLYLPNYSGINRFGGNLTGSNGHTINLPTKKQIILGKVYDNACDEKNNHYVFHFNYSSIICTWSNNGVWQQLDYVHDLFASGLKPFFYYTGQYGHGVSQSGCSIEKLELGLYVYELL